MQLEKVSRKLHRPTLVTSLRAIWVELIQSQRVVEGTRVEWGQWVPWLHRLKFPDVFRHLCSLGGSLFLTINSNTATKTKQIQSDSRMTTRDKELELLHAIKERKR